MGGHCWNGPPFAFEKPAFPDAEPAVKTPDNQRFFYLDSLWVEAYTLTVSGGRDA
jgi:hypothetical protein